MSGGRITEPKSSPFDRGAIARQRTTLPGWPEEGIEKCIYEAAGPEDFGNLANHFLDELPGGIDDAAADHVISVIQDAWNYLPHRSLGGRSPADLMDQ
jgi:hypothetical protein